MDTVTTVLLLAVFAFFIFSMFRRNKKAQQQQAEMQSKFSPGVEVMTSFGLFGRIVSVDDAENKVVLELSPGHQATVHRQAVTKVVEPTDPVVEESAQSTLDADPYAAPTPTVPTVDFEKNAGTAAAEAETVAPEIAPRSLDDEGKNGK